MGPNKSNTTLTTLSVRGLWSGWTNGSNFHEHQLYVVYLALALNSRGFEDRDVRTKTSKAISRPSGWWCESRGRERSNATPSEVTSASDLRKFFFSIFKVWLFILFGKFFFLIIFGKSAFMIVSSKVFHRTIGYHRCSVFSSKQSPEKHRSYGPIFTFQFSNFLKTDENRKQTP